MNKERLNWKQNIEVANKIQQRLSIDSDIDGKVEVMDYINKDKTTYNIEVTIDLPQSSLGTNPICQAIAKVLKMRCWTNVSIEIVNIFSNSVTFQLEAEIEVRD